jgi:N-dimethylarginine dimethylaminohydrolase
MNFPNSILMIKPNHFRVDYVINSHMDTNNKVDSALALKQWQGVKDAYESLGFKVIVYDDHIDYPDIVFCANQTFFHPKGIILSCMQHDQRKGEVEFFKKWFSDYEIKQAPESFEAMGDLLWDYQGERLFGGYGYRTNESVYDWIEEIVNIKIKRLKLVSDNYYHLDTCLSIIDSDTAFYVESAFEQDAIEILKNSFQNLIKVDENEALDFLACNCHSPDGKNILIEKGAVKLQADARELGLNVLSLDTSEFRKSGGSIFCMKNQVITGG